MGVGAKADKRNEYRGFRMTGVRVKEIRQRESRQK